MSTPVTPPFNIDNVQGDIIVGLPKRVQKFVLFQITDPTLFRKQLTTLLPLITTTRQALADLDAIAKHRKNKQPGLHPVKGCNIAFSSFGLKKLGADPNIGDSIFTAGQKVDAVPNLGDVPSGKKDANGIAIPAWEAPFLLDLDGILVITSESRGGLQKETDAVEKALAGSIKIATTLDGAVRPGKESGHEHFGYQDGISQPAIINFGKPHLGQRAVPSSVILLQNDPQIGVTNLPAIAIEGSILAFRKLKQNVPEFNDFVIKNGKSFDGMSDQEGADLFGARLVGRWKSGAPIDVTPFKDNIQIAKDPERNNDFDYTFKNPDDFTSQIRCPFSAHVRKTNPRNDLDSLQPNAPILITDTRRIMRQGIPYGPEVTHQEEQQHKTIEQRGLAFVCYQSQLGKGFHFIQQSWANAPDFVKPSTGFDPIIGQNGNPADNRDRKVFGVDPNDPAKVLDIPKDFVESLGGEYFFSPSISVLRDTLATK